MKKLIAALTLALTVNSYAGGSYERSHCVPHREVHYYYRTPRVYYTAPVYYAPTPVYYESRTVYYRSAPTGIISTPIYYTGCLIGGILNILF